MPSQLQYLQMSSARRQTEGEALAQKLQAVMDAAFAGNLKPSRARRRPAGRCSARSSKAGDHVIWRRGGGLELVRVSDPNAGKIWLIASDTLAKVPDLYDQVEARQVETRLPKWVVKHQLAGMPLWQWFALFLLIPVAAAIAWVLLAMLQIPLRWWARRHGHAELESRSVSGPAWLLLGT